MAHAGRQAGRGRLARRALLGLCLLGGTAAAQERRLERALTDQLLGGSARSLNLLDDPRVSRQFLPPDQWTRTLMNLRGLRPYRAGRRRYLVAALPPPDPAVEAAIRQSAPGAAARERIRPEALVAIARAESGFRNIPTAVRRLDGQPASSAFGPFQFLRGTWAEVASGRPELGLNEADRRLPVRQTVGAAVYASDLETRLATGLRRAPSVLDVYGAWVFGPDSGLRIARARPQTPMERLVDAEALANNRAWGLSVKAWRDASAARLGAAASVTVRMPQQAPLLAEAADEP